MNIKQELLIYFVYALCGAYFCVKFLAPMIQIIFESLFSKKNNSKPKQDINSMVERKKQLLQRGVSSTRDLNAKKTHQSNHLAKSTVEKYTDKLSVLSDEEEKNQIRKILKLYDDCQWGNFEELLVVQNKIKSLWGITPDSSSFSKSLKEIFQSNLINQRKRLLNYNEILDLLTLKTCILFFVRVNNEPKQIEQISIRLNILRPSLIKAFCSTMEKLVGSSPDYEKLVKKNPNDIDLTTYKDENYLLDEEHKFFIEFRNFRKTFEQEAFLFSSIEDLPELEMTNNPILQAYNILNLKSITTIDLAKKNYKRLANLRHPDKLKAMGLPASCEKKATKNFTILKQAFDLVKDDLKDKYERK